MTTKTSGCFAFCAALVLAAGVAPSASAQCCGGGTAVSYYQPAAYTAYSPVAYQSYYSGWYPGYWLDRVRTRLWGSPSTYVAAYPSTYAAAYPSTVVASYQPAYTASYATSYAPASACATCSTYTAGYSPCTTCAVQQVTMRPVCETCSVSCDPCSACSAYGVSQTTYQSSGCTTCNGGRPQQGGQSGTTIVVPNGTVVTPGGQQQPMPANGGAQPMIGPTEQVPQERTYQRPADENGPNITPEPAGDINGSPADYPNGTEGNNATFFEAPKLFNPKDRTANRRIAPVRTALYEQPVGYAPAAVVRTKITAQQAAQDATGWISASN